MMAFCLSLNVLKSDLRYAAVIGLSQYPMFGPCYNV